jgi:diguanylate cyclase (GGDEF)-like protein/PAS domain S-box-containing protein
MRVLLTAAAMTAALLVVRAGATTTAVIAGAALLAVLAWVASRAIRLGEALGAASRRARADEAALGALRDIVDHTQELVRVVDRDGRLLHATPSLERALGFTLDELRALPPRALVSPEDRWRVEAAVDAAFAGESPPPLVHRVRTRAGDVRWLVSRVSPLRAADGSVRAIVTSSRDLSTTRTETTDALAGLAREVSALRSASTKDELTGLANRRGFDEAAGAAHAEAIAHGRHAAVLFVDLDGLKSINDDRGHAAGDEAIRTVGKVLRACSRRTDVIARIGGDELLVFARDVDAAGAAMLERRIHYALALANHARARPLVISIGWAVLDPKQPPPLVELVREADRRMYVAKTARRESRRSA